MFTSGITFVNSSVEAKAMLGQAAKHNEERAKLALAERERQTLYLLPGEDDHHLMSPPPLGGNVFRTETENFSFSILDFLKDRYRVFWQRSVEPKNFRPKGGSLASVIRTSEQVLSQISVFTEFETTAAASTRDLSRRLSRINQFHAASERKNRQGYQALLNKITGDGHLLLFVSGENSLEVLENIKTHFGSHPKVTVFIVLEHGMGVDMFLVDIALALKGRDMRTKGAAADDAHYQKKAAALWQPT